MPEAKSDWVNWRMLEHLEIIEDGDEYDACRDGWRDDPIWKPAPVHRIGQPASDPQYPAHTRYRRRKLPTDAAEMPVREYNRMVELSECRLDDVSDEFVDAVRMEVGAYPITWNIIDPKTIILAVTKLAPAYLNCKKGT